MNYTDKLFQNHSVKLFSGHSIKLFSGYVIFAGFASFVDISLLYSLTEFLHLWYLYSAIIAYLIGMIINYSLNKYLNFKNKSNKIISQFGLFATVALIGLVLNQFILYYLVEFAKLWYMFAKIIALFIVMFWSYYGHSRLTFNLFK